MRSLLRSLIVNGSVLVVAAGFAAALLTFAFADVRLFPMVFAATFVLGAFLGLPLYFAVRSRGTPRRRTALAAGFLVGALLPALLMLTAPTPGDAWIGATPTVIDGQLTAFGRIRNLLILGLFGVAGGLGGLLFWQMAREQAEESDEQFTAMDEGRIAAGDRSRKRAPGSATVAIVVAAVLVIGAAFAIPPITRDRSCHALISNETGLGVAPEVSARLPLPRKEWREFADIMRAFAAEHGWSYRGDVRPFDDFVWFQVSICGAEGTQILANSNDALGDMHLHVYQPQGGVGWRRQYSDFHKKIEARWPGKLKFIGDVGQAVDLPAWLAAGLDETRPAEGPP